MRPDYNANGGPPRWVKVFGAVVALILVSTAVAVHLAGGGVGHLGHASAPLEEHGSHAPRS